jgi:leucyl aminopeptidase (aminopeptidase T)
MELLDRAARVAISDCLGLVEGQSFLVISNPDTEQETIAKALVAQAEAQGVKAKLILQPVKSQAEYTETPVLEAIASAPEAMASISTSKLGKDRKGILEPYRDARGKAYDHLFTYMMGKGTSRAFWSPAATVDMFSRTVAIDYGLMRRRATILAQILDEAVALQVRAPSGTDLFIGVEGRNASRDDGDFRSAGSGGNLPAGEVFISPALRNAEGRIVFDGSIADIGGAIVIRNPINCPVSRGFVLACEGGREAEALEQALRKGMEMASGLAASGSMSPEESLERAANARHLGEFGIGLNTEARITGKILEDEKVYGTCHIAIGYNYDGDAPAMIHLDGLIHRPTITALLSGGVETVIMRDGILLEQ